MSWHQVQRYWGLRGDCSQLQDWLDGSLVDLAHTGGLQPHGSNLRHKRNTEGYRCYKRGHIGKVKSFYKQLNIVYLTKQSNKLLFHFLCVPSIAILLGLCYPLIKSRCISSSDRQYNLLQDYGFLQRMSGKWSFWKTQGGGPLNSRGPFGSNNSPLKGKTDQP